MPDEWARMERTTFRSEEEVKQRLLHPLFLHLGWTYEEIHADVPVRFKLGSKAGRKHEADFALAEPRPSPPRTAWLVVEAKNPGDSLDDAPDQAWSYTLALHAPIFVVSNGVTTEVWLVRWGSGQDHELALRVTQQELSQKSHEIAELLAPAPVRARALRFNERNAGAPPPDLADYIRATCVGAPDGPVARSLRVEGLPREAGARNLRWPPLVEDGAGYLLCGAGGRGKTVCLWQVLLRNAPNRLPLLVTIGSWHVGGLLELMEEKLSPHVPGLSRASLPAFLHKHPCLLCVDDWHKGDPRFIEKAKAELAGPLAHVPVVVSTRGEFSTRIRERVVPLQVGPLSEGELEELVIARGSFRTVEAFWRIVPTLLRPLLHEPIFLGIALDLVQATDEGTVLPGTVDTLMNGFFQASLADQGDIEQLGALALLCEELADIERFTLTQLASATSALGTGLDAASLAKALTQVGVLGRGPRLGEYVFGHDLWKEYFRCRKAVRSLTDSQAVQAWIDKQGPSLDTGAFFLASMLSDPDRQAELLAGLLSTTFPTYLSALRTRVSVERSLAKPSFETYCLAELRRGYDDLLRLYLPNQRLTFDPWNGGPDAPIVVVGSVSDAHLSYTFACQEEGDREVDAAPDWRMVHARWERRGGRIVSRGSNLQASGRRPDSGRLESVRQVLAELARRMERLELPDVEWVVRERFAEMVSRARRELLDCDVFEATPGAVHSALVVMEQDERANGLVGDIAFHWGGVVYTLPEITSLASRLVEIGLGDTMVKDLILPFRDHRNGGRFSLYSYERALERVRALYAAVSKTYGELCSDHLAPLSRSFRFRDGPLRAVVYLHPEERTVITWWEPSSYWGAEPRLLDAPPPRDASLMTEIRESFQKAGRRETFTSYSWRVIPWATFDSVVTKTVARMLAADIKRLEKRIEGCS